MIKADTQHWAGHNGHLIDEVCSIFLALSRQKYRSGNSTPLRSHPQNRAQRIGPQWLPGLDCMGPHVSKSDHNSESIRVPVAVALAVPHWQSQQHSKPLPPFLHCQDPTGEALGTCTGHTLGCLSDSLYLGLLGNVPPTPFYLPCSGLS